MRAASTIYPVRNQPVGQPPKGLTARAFWALLKQAFDGWRKDNASQLAAALSYYTVFSIAPLLVIVIAIAGLVFGRQAAQGHIVVQVQALIGRDAAETLERMIEASRQPTTGVLASGLAMLTLLMGATGVFIQLKDAMNAIWRVSPPPGHGLLRTIRNRILSFGLLLGTGFLLLVSLVISAALAALAAFFNRNVPVPLALLELTNSVVSFGIITLLFAMIFKQLPDVEIPWRHVWIGAALTSCLFVIGKLLIGLYLGRTGFTSTFGAAGSLSIVLLWVYYAAQILLFGAEFTYVYARREKV